MVVELDIRNHKNTTCPKHWDCCWDYFFLQLLQTVDLFVSIFAYDQLPTCQFHPVPLYSHPTIPEPSTTCSVAQHVPTSRWTMVNHLWVFSSRFLGHIGHVGHVGSKCTMFGWEFGSIWIFWITGEFFHWSRRMSRMSRMSRRRSWLVNLKDRCAQLDEWFEEPRIIPKAMAHMAWHTWHTWHRPWLVDSFDKVIEIWDINEISMKYLWNIWKYLEISHRVMGF